MTGAQIHVFPTLSIKYCIARASRAILYLIYIHNLVGADFSFFLFMTQNLRLGNNQMSQTVIAKDLLRIYLNGFIRKLKASKFCTFIDLFCVFFHPPSFDFVFKPYRTSGDCILLPGMFLQVSANCSRQQKKTDALFYRYNYVVLQIRIFCD